tara:strand:+ start:2890 stop:3591 length:702 start_codon:yes stop_codon:yes gene_type:complete
MEIAIEAAASTESDNGVLYEFVLSQLYKQVKNLLFWIESPEPECTVRPEWIEATFEDLKYAFDAAIRSADARDTPLVSANELRKRFLQSKHLANVVHANPQMSLSDWVAYPSKEHRDLQTFCSKLESLIDEDEQADESEHEQPSEFLITEESSKNRDHKAPKDEVSSKPRYDWDDLKSKAIRMFSDDRDRLGWSSRRWARELGVPKSTFAESELCKNLSNLAMAEKINRASGN